jgi:hypothetical protein
MESKVFERVKDRNKLCVKHAHRHMLYTAHTATDGKKTGVVYHRGEMSNSAAAGQQIRCLITSFKDTGERSSLSCTARSAMQLPASITAGVL